MRFLKHRDKDNTMLMNVIYHQGRRDTNWVDHLDIIYKDVDSGEKYVDTIEKPEIDIFFAKERARNYDYNKDFIHVSETDKHTVKYADVPFYIAKQAGPNYVEMAKEYMRSGRARLRNLHKYKYVFASDYDIENWYRIWWLIENHSDAFQPRVTKAYLDIEVDGIEHPGFPKRGECPVNAVTVVDQEGMTCYTLLLRNPKNPLIQEFEDDIQSFIGELHEAFDETYGELDYRIFMYDKEDKLIVDLFKLLNTLKRDFVLIWNMGFDIPYLIDRMRELGLDPTEIMCHKDFKRKEAFYKKDTLNFAVQNKADYFTVSSYSYYADQMQWYAGNRKGSGEKRSYSLNYVAKDELGDEKLDYSEEADIKTLPYVNYRKFVMYNIKDVLLQMGIENKTGDVDGIYYRAYSNATAYQKIFKQTVFLKNRAYVEYFLQGLIIGNNTNIEYGMEYVKNNDDDDDEDEKFDGALVADPILNDFTGIDIYDKPSMYVYDNVIDEDFSSMYPNIIITFNIAPSTMIGKLIIDREYIDIINTVKDEKVEDPGKEFVDNLLIGNHALMGTKWFNLPGIVELCELATARFGIKNKIQINIDKDECDRIFVEGVYVTIEGDVA